ncbi:helix-turn-helix domain-containing protein [Serratia marcescens]|uniref:helix-turn-helix domain-containing protein n=1 Tax=Serratia marcescens TaxID=615 RepID=UPI002DBE94D1|nr:helix-turn-helix domain-containing protein [Serratia marcescens]MEB6080430.1 helix-turn-helix domain-containing protein [Serratia marcescens]
MVGLLNTHTALVRTLILWIENNIDKPLKLNDVALKAGYSRRHIQDIFLKVENKTIADYIRDKKLENACRDLLVTDLNLIDIAMKYGFDSQQNFSRLFSKKYKMPPGSWRRRHQE